MKYGSESTDDKTKNYKYSKNTNGEINYQNTESKKFCKIIKRAKTQNKEDSKITNDESGIELQSHMAL